MWRGVPCCGPVCHGVMLHGRAWNCCSVPWAGVVSHGLMWCPLELCGVPRAGVVSQGVTRCGASQCHNQAMAQAGAALGPSQPQPRGCHGTAAVTHTVPVPSQPLPGATNAWTAPGSFSWLGRAWGTAATTFPFPLAILKAPRTGRGIIGPLNPGAHAENGSLSQFASFQGKHIFFPSPNEYCKFQRLGEMSPARPDRALQKHFVTCCSHHGALTARHSRAHDSGQRMPSKPARPRLRFQVMEMPLSLRCRNVPNTLSIGM